MTGDFERIAQALRQFAAERDWDQFHTPKNLAMALNVEAGELLEHFQWLTAGESQNLPAEKREKVAEEIADIQAYLIRIADKLGVDVLDALDKKMRQNADKYPADKVRGDARKYDEYRD
jgi:dCTP diphosphatase